MCNNFYHLLIKSKIHTYDTIKLTHNLYSNHHSLSLILNMTLYNRIDQIFNLTLVFININEIHNLINILIFNKEKISLYI